MKREKGITVVELIIVIIAIGVLSAIIIPQFGVFSGFKLEGAAQKLVSHLRYAQQQAITTQIAHQIDFDPDKNEYLAKVDRNDYLNLDSEAQKSYIDDGTNVWLKDAHSGKKIDIDLGDINMSTALTQVEFNSLGSATLSGSGNEVALNYKGKSKTITITATTGRVSVQ